MQTKTVNVDFIAKSHFVFTNIINRFDVGFLLCSLRGAASPTLDPAPRNCTGNTGTERVAIAAKHFRPCWRAAK